MTRCSQVFLSDRGRGVKGTAFPVQWPHRKEERVELENLGCPRWVPWDVVAAHEKQVLRNHGQTVERLQERAGLSPRELAAALGDESLDRIFIKTLPLAEAVATIIKHVNAQGVGA